METAPKAAAMMQPGDWMFVVDMKSGYHQIPLKPSFARHCCFSWQDKVYRWLVLPFGINAAPRAYTKLSRCMLAAWRAAGIRCSNYIDDFIFFAPSLEAALELRQRVLGDMTDLGWHISMKKSLLRPGHSAVYLGYVLSSVPVPHVTVPRHKGAAALRQVQQLLQAASAGCRVSGFAVAKLVGTLQSMRFAVSPVHLFTRGMYQWLGGLPAVGGHADYRVARRLSRTVVLELGFWERQLPAWNGAVVRPGSFAHVLYTDASGEGWGGVLRRVSGRQEELAALLASHRWEEVASTDSVYTELRGLAECLATFSTRLAGCQVLHRTDSLSTYWVGC